METALRAGLEQSLLGARSHRRRGARRAKRRALRAARMRPRSAPAATIYATALAREPELDGVRETLGLAAAMRAVGDRRAGHRVWAGTYGRFVYLFISVTDRDLVYQRQAGQPPYGDRVVVAAEPRTVPRVGGCSQRGAPGRFRAQETGPSRSSRARPTTRRVIGAWQETRSGYALEVRVPLNLIGGALGVGVIDVDRSGADVHGRARGDMGRDTGTLGRFIRQVPELQSLLGQFGRARAAVQSARQRRLGARRHGPGAPGERRPMRRGPRSADCLRWLLKREDPPYPAERPQGRVADETLRQSARGSRGDGVVRQRARPRGDRRGGRADRGGGGRARAPSCSSRPASRS